MYVQGGERDSKYTIRAVMLCMLKVLKEAQNTMLNVSKETQNILEGLVTVLLIFNGKKFWKADTQSFPTHHQILCMLKHVEGIKGQKYLQYLQHALAYMDNPKPQLSKTFLDPFKSIEY